MNLLSVLAEKNIIDQKDVASIKKEVEETGELAETVLVGRGVSSDVILKAKGEHLNVPTWSFGSKEIPPEIFKYIPEEAALHYNVVPLGVKEDVLEVGITDSDNIEALDALNFISSNINMPFKTYLISVEDFNKIFKMYKSFSGEVNRAITELETAIVSEEKEKKGGIKEKRLEKAAIKEDAPVTKIVANIIRYAVEGNASDIHIEPMMESVRVRFRVDGTLHTNLVLPPKIQKAIVARIKVLSSMKLDEKRKPQDGRFSANISNRRVDFRVSTFPSYYGEKVVVRILDTGKGVWSVDKMGFGERNLAIIKNAINQPYGLILVSGPTGSGKSTTLYSMLQEMDRETKNILSLEDPVEYNIEGINQSQVRPEIGYTFANGLRTTLRQDPDIIMVGEIRDKETAQLAVQAALTGHLVLSTIHTNNALGVIPRLIEMEVDPYLIAPTLVLAIAQRLVKKLCPNTGRPAPIENGLVSLLEEESSDLPSKYRDMIDFSKGFFNAEPTSECPTGVRDRMAVFEVLDVNNEMRKTIQNNPSEAEIRKIARANGMFTMKEDAIMKALDKQIPFTEITTLGGEMLDLDPIEDLDASGLEEVSLES